MGTTAANWYRTTIFYSGAKYERDAPSERPCGPSATPSETKLLAGGVRAPRLRGAGGRPSEAEARDGFKYPSTATFLASAIQLSCRTNQLNPKLEGKFCGWSSCTS